MTEYHIKLRTLQEIANQFSVNVGTIVSYMDKFGIERRKQSQSLAISGAVRGDKNPAWNGGVSKFKYSYNWKSICKSVKDRDNWTCQMCGEQRKRWNNYLHVHHINGDKLDNSPNNLVSLCASCHHDAHSGKSIIHFTFPS